MIIWCPPRHPGWVGSAGALAILGLESALVFLDWSSDDSSEIISSNSNTEPGSAAPPSSVGVGLAGDCSSHKISSGRINAVHLGVGSWLSMHTSNRPSRKYFFFVKFRIPSNNIREYYENQGPIVSGHVFISWSNTSNSACCFGDALRCVAFSCSKHGASQSALGCRYLCVVYKMLDEDQMQSLWPIINVCR